MLLGIPQGTLARYSGAWNKFGALLGRGDMPQIMAAPQLSALSTLGTQGMLDHVTQWLAHTPLWRLALHIQTFVTLASVSQAKNLFAGVCSLPGLQQLRFEPSLRRVKRTWNASPPKYATFYAVQPLLRDLQQEQPPTQEADVRLRLLILLRLLCLFRGVDLARAHREVQLQEGTILISSQRKGKHYRAWYPVPHLRPPACDPAFWLQKYLAMTNDYQGNHLFCSLKDKAGSRKPLKEDTLNSLTTKYLKSKGLATFTAHSTRGAGATALLAAGVDPVLVQSLGDWESTACFNKFYNRWRALGAPQQALIPSSS